MDYYKAIVAPVQEAGPGVWRSSAGRVMSRDDAVCAVSAALSSGAGRVDFIFTGPEPLLAGKDFFKMFLEIENEYLRPGQAAGNMVCTSGAPLDADWAGFFAKRGIQAPIVTDGLYDGPEGPGWDAAWRAAERAAKALEAAGISPTAVCRVTAQNARRANGIYNNLKKIGFDHCRLVPWTVSPEELEDVDWALLPGQLELFLKTLFDRWYADCEAGISEDIRPFTEYVKILAGLKPGADAPENGQCRQCRWAPLCGMRAADYPVSGAPDYFCETYRWFFEYAEKRLEKLAGEEKKLAWG